MSKPRMSNFKFRCIVIPITAFLLILGVGLIIAADIFKPFMDSWFGKGEESLVGSSSLSAEYYEDKYASYEDSRAAAYEINERMADEGIILLKNNGVLPLAKNSTVAPFGYQYTDTFFGQEAMGGGSSKPVTDPTPPSTVLRTHFTVSDKTESAMKGASAQETKEASGTISASTGGGLGGNCILKEYNPNIYSSLGNLGGTGIVFLGREGHEDFDYKYDAYSDGTPHYLALTQNELGAVKAAKAACDKVVVVILSSSVLELEPLMHGEYEADAIIWAGHPGERGLVSVGKILAGEVNPSGRTVDIFPVDFTKDPTYQNLGKMYYSNSGMTDIPFIEYEEGVYVGYRYYETAVAEDDTFVYGELDGKGKIVTKGAVAYPFGYGLSYTNFEKTMTHTASNGNIEIKVSVTNKGSVAGKEVVQLYVTPPYTDYDKQNGIEKSDVSLLDFGKTSLLEKEKGNQTLTFTVNEQDFAVYNAAHENGDGTKGCYMLEAGDYVISLRNNSHDVIDSFTYNVATTVYYDNSNPRDSEKAMQAKLDAEGNPTNVRENGGEFIAATNQFDLLTEYMNEATVSLTRSNWKNTFPSRPDNNKREIAKKFADAIVAATSFDYKTDPELGNVEGSKVYSTTKPVSGANNGLTLSMLRGKDFNDPMWDKLLDQIDWSKMNTITNALFKANYMSGKINDIGLPETVHSDGANGIKNPANSEKTATYVYSPVMSATWNVELLEEFGKMVAAEAMEVGINAWYSPAFNIHRSPFAGRIFEYYSEDPILSGKVATAIVQGASDGGLQCYIKHFAMNDMETNRAKGLTTWASEQAAREIYLKPFEMVVRDARMTVKYYDENNQMQSKIMRASYAMMAAQNNFGPTRGFCNYNLLTGVVRNEWGYNGAIITDMFGTSTNIQDWVSRAGCDMFMCSMNVFNDKTSATSLNLLRNSIHRVAFSVVNSNKMQGVAPGMNKEYGISPWYAWVVPIIVAILLAGVALIVLTVLRGFDEKKHPENYKNKKRTEA